MSVRRPMGIETEYGILAPGDPTTNPMLLSARLVQAYARAGGGALRAGWDYAGEAPLDDARGFTLRREDAAAAQLTDEWGEDPRVANLVLTNGARLYVDHAHPEYSAPEAMTPRESLTWDRAGERVMAAAAAAVTAGRRPGRPAGEAAVRLYKNNTDGKGASYGTHENYLMPRRTPFRDIAAGVLPFLVVRQLLCGAGRVGLGQASEAPGYQIGARADFVEAEIGLETTFRRPLVNTRDEPHAVAERYRRLHVIVGDATLADVGGLLKLGTTSLVLRLVEDGADLSGLQLADPVAETRAVSRDLTLTHLLRLADGRRLTALDLLWAYHERVVALLRRRGEPDPDTAEVVRRWADVLTRLGGDIFACTAQIDWVAKLALLRRYRERDGLAWDDPRLAAIDLQWSDLSPGRGLARRLEETGRLERLIPETEVAAAVTEPPPSTRAWFRGECVRRYPDAVRAASWESVVFEVPDPDGAGSRLRRVGMPEPLRGTRDLTGDLLDRCPDAADLLDALTGPGLGD